MKNYIKYIFTLLKCIFLCHSMIAQENQYILKQNLIDLEAYMDIYYSYDFARPVTSQKQSYFYNYNRQNSFQLNLGYLKLKCLQEKYRANVALQAGTYVEDNYAAEPAILKHVLEANIGLSLNSKNTLWLDAGIFASHIGLESAIAFDNWNLTRSLLAENSPYYLSGLKLSYDLTPRIQLSGLVCNGWQRIEKVAGNSLASFGTQVKIAPLEDWLFNWSSFIGTDDPDSLRRMRYFNNFYAQMPIHKNLKLIFGFDLGFQQIKNRRSSYHSWLGTLLILKYQVENNPWSLSWRAEYYHDPNNVIVANLQNIIKISGFSLNFDYKPNANLLCRIEARWLKNPVSVFESVSGLKSENLSFTAALAIKIPSIKD